MTEAAGKLPKAPLAEAILELRWPIVDISSGVQHDPNYSKHQFAFAKAVGQRCPYHQPLPTAELPAQMVPYQVQHRFRSSEDGWPLMQIGPGIFSANETEKYTWKEFREFALAGAKILKESQPGDGTLNLSRAMLRYVDALKFDPRSQNPLQYLKDLLKTEIVYPPALFEQGVDGSPDEIQIQSFFPSTEPAGRVLLRFSTGTRNKKPAIIWETAVISDGPTAPEFEKLEEWIDSAHSITHDWFAKLAEGDLMQEFNSE